MRRGPFILFWLARSIRRVSLQFKNFMFRIACLSNPTDITCNSTKLRFYDRKWHSKITNIRWKGKIEKSYVERIKEADGKVPNTVFQKIPLKIEWL